jgi:hypothetical protein
VASDRIVFGAAALPEPDPAWLHAAEHTGKVRKDSTLRQYPNPYDP